MIGISKRYLLGAPLLIAISAFLFLGLQIVSPKKASAALIGSQAPMAGSGQIVGGGSTTPWFAVGEGQYDGQYSYAKIYVPTGGSATLTVQQGNGVCGIDVGSPQVSYIVYALTSSEGMGPALQAKDNGGGCGSLSFSLSSGVQSQLPGHKNYDVYFFQATINGPGIGDNEKNFRLSVSSGLVGVSNPVPNLGARPWFGIYQRDAPSLGGTNWNWNVGFAPTCAQDTTVTMRTVQIHDIDWGVYPQPNLFAAVKQDIRTDTSVVWTGATAYPGSPNPTSRYQNGFVAGNDTDNPLSYSSTSDYRYQILFQDIDWHNTIQVSLPYDQFDAQTSVQCAATITAKASCTPTPSNPTPQINQGITINVKLNNDSAAGGPTYTSTYQLRQVSPGGQAIGVSPALSPQTSENIGPYNITARSSPQTVQFQYALFDPSGKAIGNNPLCSTTVSWVNSTGPVSCTATPSNATPAVGNGITITVVLYNNSGSTIPTTYQMRQYSPGGQAKFINPALPSGSSQTLPGYAINARSTPQTVIFNYMLYTGSLAGSPAYPGVTPPMCSTTVTWGGSTPPSGTITLGCGYTNIHIKTSAIDWYYDYQYFGPSDTGYYTLNAPDVGPDTWSYIPPIDIGSPSSPPAVRGTDYYDPLTGITHYWFGTLRQVAYDNPATIIPYYVQFFDASSGAPVGGPQYGTITASGGVGDSPPIDTFNTYTFLWPHQAYTAQLWAEVNGVFPHDGPYGNYEQLNTDSMGNCLHATDNSVACQPGPSSDGGTVEPGQNYDFTYGVTLTNDTNRAFQIKSDGYNFIAAVDPGLVYLGGVPAGTSPDWIYPGTHAIYVDIPTRVEYTGGFGVIFRFQGSQLQLDSFDGSCGGGQDTPATRPYFQVWNADTSAGGGFRSPSGSCNGLSDPPYVTPAVSNDPSYKDQFSGGIRAFGSQSGGRGSMTDFGAVSMGLIPGNPGGPVGFYSGRGIIFANTGIGGLGVSNMGGYLNSNSEGHCVPDFFTNTRLSVDPPHISDPNAITASGQYTLDGGYIGGINAGTLTNRQITVYVDGNVTINGNINYPILYDPTNQANVPYFALIVRGTITLTGNVTHLDGLYVAQPAGQSGGVFATCDGTCNNQLIINGAVIAQHVELLRNHGTLGPVNSDPNGIGYNPAEIINYIPSMVIGSPYFASQYGNLESIFSLPPVF